MITLLDKLATIILQVIKFLTQGNAFPFYTNTRVTWKNTQQRIWEPNKCATLPIDYCGIFWFHKNLKRFPSSWFLFMRFFVFFWSLKNFFFVYEKENYNWYLIVFMIRNIQVSIDIIDTNWIQWINDICFLDAKKNTI